MHPARFPQQKPYRGARINWVHPSTKDLVFCALMNEQTGWPSDLVTRSIASSRTAGEVFTWVPDGARFGGNDGFDFVRPVLLNNLSGIGVGPYTLMFKFRSSISGDSYDTEFALDTYNPQWFAYWSSGGDLICNTYPDSHADFTWFNMGANQDATVVWSRISATEGGNTYIFDKNGVQRGNNTSQSSSFNIPDPTSAVRLGYSGIISEGMHGDLLHLYFWKRRMLLNEIKYLVANPYAFLMN